MSVSTRRMRIQLVAFMVISLSIIVAVRAEITSLRGRGTTLPQQREEDEVVGGGIYETPSFVNDLLTSTAFEEGSFRQLQQVTTTTTATTTSSSLTDVCAVGCPTITPTTCSTSGPSCLPKRSKDHCPPEESFAALIKARTQQYRDVNTLPSLLNDGFWFPLLEDKAASTVLAASLGYRTPQVYCCVGSVGALSSCVSSLPVADGFVVKHTGLHSNDGVFVLPNGFDGVELLTGTPSMSLSDVQNALAPLGSGKIVVEEYISGVDGAPFPTEYKVHVFADGTIGAISVVENRGTPCACYANINLDFTERLDSHGCFEPARRNPTNMLSDTCPQIDVPPGRRTCGPVKRDLPLCDNIDGPEECVLNDIETIATSLATVLGVYMRIDLFVDANGEVIVQEFSPNHMNGMRHCIASTGEGGCVNSCYMGQLWKESITGGGGTSSSLIMGGSGSVLPMVLDGWTTQSSTDQCAAVVQTTFGMPTFESSCDDPNRTPRPTPATTTSRPSAAPILQSPGIEPTEPQATDCPDPVDLSETPYHWIIQQDATVHCLSLGIATAQGFVVGGDLTIQSCPWTNGPSSTKSFVGGTIAGGTFAAPGPFRGAALPLDWSGFQRMADHAENSTTVQVLSGPGPFTLDTMTDGLGTNGYDQILVVAEATQVTITGSPASPTFYAPIFAPYSTVTLASADVKGWIVAKSLVSGTRIIAATTDTAAGVDQIQCVPPPPMAEDICIPPAASSTTTTSNMMMRRYTM